jgi:hypothetical protein
MKPCTRIAACALSVCALCARAEDGATSVAPAAAASAQRATATETLQLETTQITGNRELPKVMVIVPWKDAEPGALAGRPINSLVEETLAPIDREVMRRTLDYYKLVAGADARPRAGGTPQAVPTHATEH